MKIGNLIVILSTNSNFVTTKLTKIWIILRTTIRIKLLLNSQRKSQKYLLKSTPNINVNRIVTKIYEIAVFPIINPVRSPASEISLDLLYLEINFFENLNFNTWFLNLIKRDTRDPMKIIVTIMLETIKAILIENCKSFNIEMNS